MSKQLFILIIIYIIAIADQERLTPLSECTKGRISPYTGWEKGGQCGFGPHKNATGSSYLYPISQILIYSIHMHNVEHVMK